MLFRWIFVVFTNALVSFKRRTYVQRHGFPMGTPLAPAAANIFMAVKEDWLGLHGLQPLSDCFQSRVPFAVKAPKFDSDTRSFDLSTPQNGLLPVDPKSGILVTPQQAPSRIQVQLPLIDGRVIW